MGKHVSIIFDGTTHVYEAMVVVIRYVRSDWSIKQSVCRLMLLAESMTGEEIARQITMVYQLSWEPLHIYLLQQFMIKLL